ncbi:hypothetical protein N658DRAFT_211096 [Parathielavia hyrcaniae]|uniref:Uncharacterized protein n=1 Tax=Parathielavia hyrcaniae TaxID=113614 RepID=A0AAN6SZR4_9PEZI|nr:hypothetical protein N658DRAFT_211096 [Parathielavia hyrcaniae]
MTSALGGIVTLADRHALGLPSPQRKGSKEIFSPTPRFSRTSLDLSPQNLRFGSTKESAPWRVTSARVGAATSSGPVPSLKTRLLPRIRPVLPGPPYEVPREVVRIDRRRQPSQQRRTAELDCVPSEVLDSHQTSHLHHRLAGPCRFLSTNSSHRTCEPRRHRVSRSNSESSISSISVRLAVPSALLLLFFAFVAKPPPSAGAASNPPRSISTLTFIRSIRPTRRLPPPTRCVFGRVWLGILGTA